MSEVVKFKKGNIIKTALTEADKARFRKAGYIEYKDGKPVGNTGNDPKTLTAEIAKLGKVLESKDAEIEALKEKLAKFEDGGEVKTDSGNGGTAKADSKK